MGNASVGAQCSQFLAPCCIAVDSSQLGRASAKAGRLFGPRHADEVQDLEIALRVGFTVDQETDHPAAVKLPFKAGQELALCGVTKVQAWGALTMRQERAALQHAGRTGNYWPSEAESRFARPLRAWAVKILAPQNKDKEVHIYDGLLQVGLSKKDREMEKVKEAITDIQTVADYAQSFNRHIAETFDEHPDSVPAIRVAVPVGCFVLDSVNPHVDAGDAVMLTLFNKPSVTKFVFEGGEDFRELPQAFFHFVSWSSSGQEMVADLQGTEEEKDFLLVDPVLLRPSNFGLENIVSVLNGKGVSDTSVTAHRFERWHPRCGQLCASFDPQRRSHTGARRACGVPLPNCGVGGG
mmetsp:Transcript_42397/g.79051  ORF Transcript_42397/g.79051 Transcript_42397/m.79051 type:complete len:352 (+) Transcript_42397:64-1119(+)